jgi:hypothetical protein
MLNRGVRRDGLLKDSRCPDARGLWVFGTGSNEKQQYWPRSEANRQPEGNRGGRQCVTCKPQSAPFQSAGLESRCWEPSLTTRFAPVLTLPSTNRPGAWGRGYISRSPHPSAHTLWSPPWEPLTGTDLHSSLGYRCLFTLMGEQGRAGGGAQRNLPVQDPSRGPLSPHRRI